MGTIAAIGAPLPEAFPSLADYDDPMASAMTPILSAYWDESGKRVRERVGLDPDEWQVKDPNLEEKIRSSALAFCENTNATTSLDLADALAALRQELHEGLVESGEAIPELRDRVQKIFTGAEEWRAEMIARTEAARAVHAAQLQSAAESGVVAGMEWLVSGDACPLCLQIAAEVRMVPLGGKFATIGDSDHYKDIRHPPAHPHCMCSMVEVLMPGYGGPENPDWGRTLDQPDPPDDYEPPAGFQVPGPDPERLS